MKYEDLRVGMIIISDSGWVTKVQHVFAPSYSESSLAPTDVAVEAVSDNRLSRWYGKEEIEKSVRPANKYERFFYHMNGPGWYNEPV